MILRLISELPGTTDEDRELIRGLRAALVEAARSEEPYANEKSIMFDVGAALLWLTSIVVGIREGLRGTDE